MKLNVFIVLRMTVRILLFIVQLSFPFVRPYDSEDITFSQPSQVSKQLVKHSTSLSINHMIGMFTSLAFSHSALGTNLHFFFWQKDGLVNFNTLREGSELLICGSVRDEHTVHGWLIFNFGQGLNTNWKVQ